MTNSSFSATYRKSLERPEEFWAEAALDIDWTRRWDTVLDNDASPAARWFVGGQLNTCYNALDRHADAGRGDQPALIFDSGVTGTTQTFTYLELRDRVARFAGVLSRCGVSRGDRHVGVRAARRRSFGCVRRLRSTRTRGSYRRLHPQGHCLCVVRSRGEPGDRVQAVARWGDGNRRPQPGSLCHLSARDGSG